MQESFNPDDIRIIDPETIGDEPFRETYEVYEGSGKLMELAYYEHGNLFQIYVQNIHEGIKSPGETTELFKKITKRIQDKANELHQPVRLVLDPVVDVVKKWAKTKAAEVVQGWDSIDATDGRFEKNFYPANKN